MQLTNPICFHDDQLTYSRGM